MTNINHIENQSPAAAMSVCSALITGEPVYIGIISKKNGHYRVGVSETPEWSSVLGRKEKLVGVYSVPHMSQKEAMFAALQIGQAAKKAKKAGIRREQLNRLVDQAARRFENQELAVIQIAA